MIFLDLIILYTILFTECKYLSDGLLGLVGGSAIMASSWDSTITQFLQISLYLHYIGPDTAAVFLSRDLL